MKERHLSFYYLDGNHIPEYREKIIRYLETKEEDIEKLSFPYVWVNLHSPSKRENPRPTGHIFIQDMNDNEGQFEEICKFVLSKERRFIPVEVDCRFKKDYKMIESILRENYGEKGRLTNGFLGLCALFGTKRIKRR
jgi:hypothetical protein